MREEDQEPEPDDALPGHLRERPEPATGRGDWPFAPVPPPADAAALGALGVRAEEDLRRGLIVWFGILLLAGGCGLLLGMEEMAALTALGGLFVASQAADLSPRWAALYYLTSWVVPVGGAAISVAVGVQVFNSGLTEPTRFLMVALAAVSAATSVFFVYRPLANRLVALLMRQPPSHTLRLAARLILIGLVLAIPTWFALRGLFGESLEDTGALLEHASLGGQLVGYFILAMASVGFMLRRDLRATLDRLGLQPITRSHLAIVAIGVMALYGLNAGADWLQQSFFHDLWLNDHRINQAIAAGMSPGRILLFGLSAGVGEEITIRGALQPKLGLFVTSLLFASLHVQYSWYGIAVIFLLGLLLGTIRITTSTTVAIAVHMIYDVIAVLSV